MKYEKMLKRAREDVPERVYKDKRFKVPSIKSYVEGNKTIVKNFSKIADYLNRDKKHMLKYLSKELATSGDIDKSKAVFNGKFKKRKLKKKLKNYVEDFVKCPECDSADTKMTKKEGVDFIKCMACQAEHPIKNIK